MPGGHVYASQNVQHWLSPIAQFCYVYVSKNELWPLACIGQSVILLDTRSAILLYTSLMKLLLQTGEARLSHASLGSFGVFLDSKERDINDRTLSCVTLATIYNKAASFQVIYKNLNAMVL